MFWNGNVKRIADFLHVDCSHKPQEYQAWTLEDAKLVQDQGTEGKFHQSDTCLSLVWADSFFPWNRSPDETGWSAAHFKFFSPQTLKWNEKSKTFQYKYYGIII